MFSVYRTPAVIFVVFLECWYFFCHVFRYFSKIFSKHKIALTYPEKFPMNFRFKYVKITPRQIRCDPLSRKRIRTQRKEGCMMIAYTDIFNINFYKKEIFHGSFQGMRYQIGKTDTEDGPVLTVTHWPGPYNFATTPEEQKKCRTFAFKMCIRDRPCHTSGRFVCNCLNTERFNTFSGNFPTFIFFPRIS